MKIMLWKISQNLQESTLVGELLSYSFPIIGYGKDIKLSPSVYKYRRQQTLKGQCWLLSGSNVLVCFWVHVGKKSSISLDKYF